MRRFVRCPIHGGLLPRSWPGNKRIYTGTTRYLTQEAQVNATSNEEGLRATEQTSDTGVDASKTVRETGMMLRQLKKEGRFSDMRKVVDQALTMLPWHPAYWWWKLYLQKGNVNGALEQWRTMSRLGVEKGPIHYDLMADLLMGTRARHFLFTLHEELMAKNMVGSSRFYQAILASAFPRDPQGLILSQARKVWKELNDNPEFEHLTSDPSLRAGYQLMDDTHKRERRPVVDWSPTPTPARISESKTSHDEEDIPYRAVNTQQGAADGKEQSQATSFAQARVPNVLTAENDLPIPDIPYLTAPTQRQQQARSAPLPTQITQMLEPFYGSFHKNREQHSEALGQVRQMLQESNDAVTRDYNALIRSAARNKTADELMELLEEVCERGLTPNLNTYTHIVRAFFKEQRPDEALALVDRMELSGVNADMRVVNHVLQGLFENDRAEEAKLFFLSIVNENSTTKDLPDSIISADLDRSREAFGIVMLGLSEIGQFEEAAKLLPIMIREGLEPDVRAYEPLVRAAFHRKRVPEAMKLYELAVPSFERLRESNMYWKVDVDDLAATIVSGYLINEREAEATEFLIRAASEGLWHNTNAKPYVYFIARYAQTGRVDAAWNLFETHKDKFEGFAKYRLYRAVLDEIFLGHHDIVGGMNWLREMQSSCNIAEQKPFAALLDAAMINGERAIADQIWAETETFLRVNRHERSNELSKIARKWGFLKLPSSGEQKVLRRFSSGSFRT